MLNTQSNSFTKAQWSAITHFQGPCLVLAGPGSGKTKVITHRVAHLIKEQKIPPEHILTITFTKAAALEMKERFLLLQPNTNALFGTFHSCFYHILRNSHISYPQHFISKEEKNNILKAILNRASRNYDNTMIAEVEKLLGIYINQMFQTDKLPINADISASQLEVIYKEYHQVLKKKKMTDYDMLLIDTYHLLNQNKEIRRHWQNQFQYILIDECQDMNLLQYEIIKLLTGPKQNLFLVGDDDQSIYRFRGSDIRLLNRFLYDYKPVNQIVLETNFRSTERIVSDCQKIIRKNKQRFDKNTVSFHKSNTGVFIKTFTYRDDMYQYISERLLNASDPILNDSSIICRTNAEVRFWSHIMRQHKIPYQSKEEQMSIYDESWFLDLESYMKIAVGQYELNDILRVANKPNRKIYRNELSNISKIPNDLKDDVNKIKNMRPYLAMKYIWNVVGYGKWLKNILGETANVYEDALELFQEFQEESKRYCSIEDWLNYIQEDRVALKSKQSNKNQEIHNGVHILTMHASKGLEFDTVYLPDINKGKIPRGFLLDEETIEEERRLLYVAMTRAKKNLEIIYIKGTEGHKLEPSEFIQPLLK